MREDHFVHPHPARQPSRDEVNNNQQSWLDIIAEHDHTPSEEEKEEEEEGCTEREGGVKVFCCMKGVNII